jgi:hypothetical protein
MSEATPKCNKVCAVYHFEHPSEEKLRTPGLFEEEIKRFGARCGAAKDEIEIIKGCSPPECQQEAAKADKEIAGLKEEIADLKKKIAAERRKEEPREKLIKDWTEKIRNCETVMKEVAADKAEWLESRAVCRKLKGEWEKELKSLRGILDTLLREWKKGSPWKCGAPTKDNPPGRCGYPSNYVYGEWTYCPLHR